jgi:hypothetical protein
MVMLIKKRVSIFVVTAMLAMVASTELTAQKESFFHSGKGYIQKGDSSIAADDKYLLLGTADWVQVKNKTVKNAVTLKVRFDTISSLLRKPFNAEVIVDILYWGADQAQTEPRQKKNISLRIQYDTGSRKPNVKTSDVYLFEDAHKVLVVVKSVKSNVFKDSLPPILALNNEIFIEREYKFDPNQLIDVKRTLVSDEPKEASLQQRAIISQTNTANCANPGSVQLSWTFSAAAEYDLEYAFIDENSDMGVLFSTYPVSGGTVTVPDYVMESVFRFNSTRVTLPNTKTFHNINLVAAKSYLIYRIRGVAYAGTDPYVIRNEGVWTYSDIYGKFAIKINQPHECNLNWQYTASFAEEGKQKEVVGYFDGKLQSRQTVTINNDENLAVVQETVLDEFGMAAATILPAPAQSSWFQYFRNFNTNGTSAYSYTDISYGATCAISALPLNTSSGSAMYYSASNPFMSNEFHNAVIPDASGYPLAVTEYTPDQTGRIKRQGGVGPDFQIGTGRETKYFYGKPSSQREIDRLFGSEAGDFSHYLKNMVVDPNKGISISYINSSGKTVATALAGNPPENLEELPGTPASVYKLDRFIKGSDLNYNSSNGILIGTSRFLAASTGNYGFFYTVKNLRYLVYYGANAAQTICTNCYYNVVITVKDNCGLPISTQTIPAGNAFNTNCNVFSADIQGNFAANITQIGEYSVTYSLEISKEATEFYKNWHWNYNSDLKRFYSFFDEKLAEMNFLDCYSDCDACKKLGTYEDFEAEMLPYIQKLISDKNDNNLNIDNNIIIDYLTSLYNRLTERCNEVSKNCETSPCDASYSVILQDVSPGGQYALYDEQTFTLLDINTNVLKNYSSTPVVYVDENGNPDMVMNDLGFLVTPNDLALNEFITKFKPSWAKALALYHPEYCYYEWCVQNVESERFNERIAAMPGEEAVALGYYIPRDVDPNAFDVLLNNDPFFNGSGNGVPYRDAFLHELANFSKQVVGPNVSIKHILGTIDYLIYCKDDWDQCAPANDCRKINREWELLVSYYLKLKARYNEMAKACSYAFSGGCSNCYIGFIEDKGTCQLPPANYFTLVNLGGGCYKYDYSGFVDNEIIIKVTVAGSSGNYQLDVTIKGGKSESEQFCLNPGETVSSFYLECPPNLLDPNNAGCNPVSLDPEWYNLLPQCPVPPEPNPPVYSGPCIPSNCTGDPRYPDYQDKTRVYMGYRNTCDDATECTNPSNLDANAAIISLCQTNCYSSVNELLEKLVARGCLTVSDPNYNTIKGYLMEICGRGCVETNPPADPANPNVPRNLDGTSSVTPGYTTFNSFDEVIAAYLGTTAVENGCATDLINIPYPIEVIGQYFIAPPIVREASSDICSQLAWFHNNGYPVSSETMKDFYLTPEQLADLEATCNSKCPYLLNADITMPAALMKKDGCRSCDDINNLYAVFSAKYPSLAGDDPEYEMIFKNFMNHQLGFTLSYADYYEFKIKCETNSGAILCDATAAYLAEETPYRCIKEMTANAFNQAVYSFYEYKDSVDQAFVTAYRTRCSYVDATLDMNAPYREYHFTLYYYDQAGNLVRTVPPAGVQTLTDGQVNSIIHPWEQPDAGYSVKLNAHPTNAGKFSTTSQRYLNGPFTLEWQYKPNTLPGAGITTTLYDARSDRQLATTSGTITDELTVKLTGTNSISILYQFIAPGWTYRLNFSGAVTIPGGLTLNQWHTIAVTINPYSTLQKITVNGKPYVFNATYSYSAVSGTNSIGVNQNTFNPSSVNSQTAQYRQLRIYNRMLSNNELLFNHLKPLTPYTVKNLLTYKIFSEGANAIVDDEIAVHQGTLSQSYTWVNDIPFVPAPHTLVTSYAYNSLNQVYAQNTPDGGSSKFWYDALGRMVASQNAEQLTTHELVGDVENRFSYTKYDALGRITEVGEKIEGINITEDYARYKTWLSNTWHTSGFNRQITRTWYDDVNSTYGIPNDITINQFHLRKRVASVFFFEDQNSDYRYATHYSYDVSGNVKTLWQDLVPMRDHEDLGYKRIDYAYDLISGKVNHVWYQRNKLDQFYYKYDYDAENRLVKAWSGLSDQPWNLKLDAAYKYYLHGPLARTELGEEDNKLQGLDYAYTLQGWLKGVNSSFLNVFDDIGKDADPGNMHDQYGRDVFNYTLNYYGSEELGIRDFTPIDPFLSGNARPFIAFEHVQTVNGALTGRALYNGNIAAISLALRPLHEGTTTGYSYGYDQLNRLVNTEKHDNDLRSWGGYYWNSLSPLDDYREHYEYDANGNIVKLDRNGDGNMGYDLDRLYYNYDNGNNQLTWIKDDVDPGVAYDIDDQSGFQPNYRYDNIGNLLRDEAGEVSLIRWTVYGKIKSIEKNNGDVITYDYDPSGNRVHKFYQSPEQGIERHTYYIRDAQGNVLSVYEFEESTGVLIQKEQHLYGSARLGMYKPELELCSGCLEEPSLLDERLAVGEGEAARIYELTNHLGNVLVTIQNYKQQVWDNDAGQYVWEPVIITANDYYSFGMLMPVRQYVNGEGYRYGINGQEKDIEIDGEGNMHTAEFWEYDAKTARRWNIDPRPNPSTSVYATFAGNPIRYTDVKGDTAIIRWNTGFLGLGKRHEARYVGGQWIDSRSRGQIDINTVSKSGVRRLMNDYQTLNGIDDFDPVTTEINNAVNNVKLDWRSGPETKGSEVSTPKYFNNLRDGVANPDIDVYSVAHNSQESRIFEGGKKQIVGSYIALGHELGHVWDILTSGGARANFIQIPGLSAGITASERNAMYWENVLRAHGNLPLRTHYNYDNIAGLEYSANITTTTFKGRLFKFKITTLTNLDGSQRHSLIRP